jgi:Lecithin retinol acyltransferase
MSWQVRTLIRRSDQAVMLIPQNQMFMARGVGHFRKHLRLEERRCKSTSRAEGPNSPGLCRGDRLLAAHEKPPLGAHLVTPRFAYAHHGVYVGDGAVVHYGAYTDHWRRGPVEEVSLTRFAHRHPVWVRAGRPNGLQSAQIVRLARSRLGEDRYRFFTNNCEHFSEWCVNGEHRSPQVERLLAPLRRALRAPNEMLRLLKATPQRGGGWTCARTT